MMRVKNVGMKISFTMIGEGPIRLLWYVYMYACLAEVGMQDISSQFEVSDNSIRTSLVQIGHDIFDIKEKIDIILQYLGAQN